MRKQQITIIALFLWLTIVAVCTILTQIADLSLFFFLGFMGILVIVQLLEPRYARPSYLRYVRYLIMAGIVIFGVIIVQKVVVILAR